MPNIFFQHHLGVLLNRFLTIFIMVDALLAITFYDVSAEEPDSFDGHLTFTRALFNGLEVLYWIFSTAESILCVKLFYLR